MKKQLLTLVFSKARNRLQAVARRFSADDEAANDVLQEAFLKLWSSKANPADESEALALSTTTVKNLCIDAARRRSSNPTVSLDDDTDRSKSMIDEADDSTSDRAETADLYAEISAMIDCHLSERDRAILYLRERDGWDFDELAERFSLSEANVRLILSRARRTIRTIYLSRFNP